ncbi:MAG TPA: hypothetical protein VME41_16590 [Stellaceae bacterium]|nr:hypothetical protein [Stellaceae bacterium]
MRLPRPFVLLLLALTLAGCAASGSEPPAAAPVPNAVARSSEAGGRFIALVGPRRQFAAPFLGVPGTNFDLLRSWIDTQNSQVLTQLYVEDSYSGAVRTYDTARTSEGETLKFVPISKNKIACDNGCSYAEEIAADLPEPLLQAHRQGLAVVFSAQSGPDLAIAVPGDLIDRQLAAIADARATLPVAAAAPSPANPRP